MNKFNKKLLIPILTVVALLIKTVFKIDIPDAAIDIAADVVMYIIALVGMFIHPQVTDTTQTGGQQNVNTQRTDTFESNR